MKPKKHICANLLNFIDKISHQELTQLCDNNFLYTKSYLYEDSRTYIMFDYTIQLVGSMVNRAPGKTDE